MRDSDDHSLGHRSPTLAPPRPECRRPDRLSITTLMPNQRVGTAPPVLFRAPYPEERRGRSISHSIAPLPKHVAPLPTPPPAPLWPVIRNGLLAGFFGSLTFVLAIGAGLWTALTLGTPDPPQSQGVFTVERGR